MQSARQEPSTLHAEVIRLQDCLAASEQQRAAQETLLEERAQRIEQLLDLITLLKRKQCLFPDRHLPRIPRLLWSSVR